MRERARSTRACGRPVARRRSPAKRTRHSQWKKARSRGVDGCPLQEMKRNGATRLRSDWYEKTLHSPNSYILQIPLFSKFLYSPNSYILQIPLFSKFLYSLNSFILSIPIFSHYFILRPPPTTTLPPPPIRHPTSSSAQTAVPQHARSLRTAGKRMAGPWDPARGPLDRTRVQSSTHPRPRRRSRLLSAEDGGDAC